MAKRKPTQATTPRLPKPDPTLKPEALAVWMLEIARHVAIGNTTPEAGKVALDAFRNVCHLVGYPILPNAFTPSRKAKKPTASESKPRVRNVKPRDVGPAEPTPKGNGKQDDTAQSWEALIP